MMDKTQLTQLLEAVQAGRLSVADAAAQWSGPDSREPDFAVLDHARGARTGMPEVVFCQGKTPAQVVQIVGRLLANEGRALATRASTETADAILAAYPQARWHQAARILALGDIPPAPSADAPFVAVVTAGTSDIPVAEEAALTLEFLGHSVRRVYDVGVAGIHRLMNRLDVLRQAQRHHRSGRDGGRARQRARRAGRLPRGGRADQRRLRRELRRPGRAAGDAELVRAGRGGGEHRQRVRRCGARAPDHAPGKG